MKQERVSTKSPIFLQYVDIGGSELKEKHEPVQAGFLRFWDPGLLRDSAIDTLGR